MNKIKMVTACVLVMSTISGGAYTTYRAAVGDPKPVKEQKDAELPAPQAKKGVSVTLKPAKAKVDYKAPLEFGVTIDNRSVDSFTLYDGTWTIEFFKDAQGPWIATGTRLFNNDTLTSKKEVIRALSLKDARYEWGGPERERVPPRKNLLPGTYRARITIEFTAHPAHARMTPRYPWLEGKLVSEDAKFTIEGKDNDRLDEADYGGEVQGLRTKIDMDFSKYEVGKPIEVRYWKKNTGKADLVLWHSGFWPNHMIRVVDAKKNDVPLTNLGDQCRKAFAPGGGRDKNVRWPLKPGDADDTEGQYDLTQLFDLSKPGKYRVLYVYEENQADGWKGRVDSNSLEFEVVK